MSVNEVKEMLLRTEKGAVKSTIGNCLIVLQNDPYLAGALAYNLLAVKTYIVKPLWYQRPEESALNDTELAYIRLYMESNYGLTCEKKIKDAVTLAAHENSFHPGCKFDVMLCLVGGQGAGKSTFFRFLAIKDDWFSDDLRKLDDDSVFEKLQGYWIIEMSEMIATANAKSIEEIKSFLSRQKENYRIRYDKFASDRLRQGVFGGTSNTMDFLPLDIQKILKDRQQNFMPEDTKAGMIQAFLDAYKGNTVCSKLLYKEALDHPYNDPQHWELREICDIMNQSIVGWKYFSNPRTFAGYGRQRGWERDISATKPDNSGDITQENLFDGFIRVEN